MVSSVASLDQLPLLSLRIVVRRLAATAIQRKPVSRLVAHSSVSAPRRRLVAAKLGRGPYAAFAVQHRVVRIGWIVRRIRPEMFVAPEKRRSLRSREARRNLGLIFARGNVDRIRAVLSRIHHDQL